jgi:hypothetical protein
MSGLSNNSDSKLLSQQSGQAGLVSKIDPVTGCCALLLLLRLAQHDPIESLGTADGRAQPDLLGWGLLVDNVGAVRRVDDVEDAGLCGWSADARDVARAMLTEYSTSTPSFSSASSSALETSSSRYWSALSWYSSISMGVGSLTSCRGSLSLSLGSSVSGRMPL